MSFFFLVCTFPLFFTTTCFTPAAVCCFPKLLFLDYLFMRSLVLVSDTQSCSLCKCVCVSTFYLSVCVCVCVWCMQWIFVVKICTFNFIECTSTQGLWGLCVQVPIVIIGVFVNLWNIGAARNFPCVCDFMKQKCEARPCRTHTISCQCKAVYIRLHIVWHINIHFMRATGEGNM